MTKVKGGKIIISVLVISILLISFSLSFVSSSPSSSGGGDDSVTNVYNTYITNENDESLSGANDEQTEDNKGVGITGGIIGNLLSGSSLIFIIIIGGLLVVFIISRTIIRVKKK